MSQLQCPTELLVDATVAGTTYRKLICYNFSNIDSLRSVKVRVLEDMKAAGAPMDNPAEVVLRNYTLTDYEHTSFNSAAAKSCALNDENSWGSGCRSCRLLAAEPSPQVPIGPADASRHAMLAIAARQMYDRALGSGFVLPLEARVKPMATLAGLNASEAAAAAAQTADPNDLSLAGPAVAPSSNGFGIDSHPFDITVRDFRGRCHLVRVCGGISVSRLKAGIAAALGCSVYSHWRLLHDGRPLDDQLDLADYSISAGALVEVQMTSKLPCHLKGEGKEGTGSGSSCGSGIGGSGIGGGAKVAPNCGAPWANPVGKAAAAPSQMAVQVLLPCGRAVHVPRLASEQVPLFVCRALEAEKALLTPAAAPENGPAALAAAVPPPPPAASAPAQTPLGSLPGCPGGDRVIPTGQTPRTNSSPQLSGRDIMETKPRAAGRQLQGAIIGQQLLALLLAAAAVVMAMAVL